MKHREEGFDVTEDDRVRPFAASVRHLGPGPLPEGTDYPDELSGDEPEQYGSDAKFISTVAMDERALEARRNAPPTPKPEPTPERRAEVVRQCYDAVVAWRGVFGAANLFVEAAAAELGVGVPEMEALLDEEAARRRKR